MYIHKVTLRDVRGFEKLEIKFDRVGQQGQAVYAGWNVLTGDNASGKTTVLKAIALAIVGPEMARALQPSFSGWVRANADTGTIAVQLVAGSEDTFSTGRRPKAPFYAELQLNGVGAETEVTSGTKFVSGKKSARNGPWLLNQGVWFAAAYGPFRRLYGTSTDAMRLMSSPGRPPRFATLFKEDATLGESQNWLKDLRFKGLEDRVRERSLLSAVLSLLEADFLSRGLRVDRVDSEGLWLKSTDGVVLSLSDMSDGYRSALALLVDILRHLSIAYPDQDLVRDEGDKKYAPHEGVVLIDEVDAHLHPEWQRKIGFWLKGHFPNIQFIVSTHSPFACQAADDLGIYALSAPAEFGMNVRLNQEDWQRIVAGSVDQILSSPAFGLKYTRSPRAVKAREEWSKLKAKATHVKLSPDEKRAFKQLALFVETGAESE